MTEPTPIPDELRSLAAQKVAAMTTQRIAKVEWQGKLYWVKKPVPPKATSWTKLQGLFARVIRLPILRPTTNPGGIEGLRLEAWRMREFRQAGFPAPNILAMTDEWMLQENLGEMIERKLQKDTAMEPKALADIICDCAEAIAKLHKGGLAHGRAKLNDLTLMPDGSIGFIDFEENIVSGGAALPALQARDLWLFICSAGRFEGRYPGLMQEAYEEYLSVNNDVKVKRELKKLLRLLALFRYILWPFHKMLGGDFERAYTGTMALWRLVK